MYQMTETERAERAQVKAIHKAVRDCGPAGSRYRNLAWGFIRGFKYRRIERSHHIQAVSGNWAHAGMPYRQIDEVWFYEHNMPSESLLFDLLKKHVPGVTKEQISAWLRDTSGAIPVPAPRPRKPYVAALPQAG